MNGLVYGFAQDSPCQFLWVNRERVGVAQERFWELNLGRVFHSGAIIIEMQGSHQWTATAREGTARHTLVNNFFLTH